MCVIILWGLSNRKGNEKKREGTGSTGSRDGQCIDGRRTVDSNEIGGETSLDDNN